MTVFVQRTLPAMFEESVSRYSTNILLWEKKNDSYQGTTYKAAQILVYQCAAGLISLGIKKGERLALISEGRSEWVISELGILFAGAINVPLSVKIDELADLKFRLAHSGCRFVIVSGAQAEKIRAVKNDLPELEKIILLDGEPRTEEELSFKDLLETGKNFLDLHKSVFEERWHSINENDSANICYTSGTTADPKGIILTHRNYTANIEQSSALLEIPEWYCSLLILPWDHAFAHTAGVYALMKNGASIASIQLGRTPMETLKNIPLNIRETRPTFLLSVPSLAKNFRKNIEKGIREKGEGVERLFAKALELAYSYNGIGWDRGKNTPLSTKLQVKLYDFLIFRKIRKNFGGRLEFFIGGGALLDIELQRFFYAIGIPMYQGYGLTEAAPVISANVPKMHKLGSSGRVVVNLEVKICDSSGNELPIDQKGEIVVKGENVMAGYWRNEKATQQTIRGGWLYTGDLGYLDDDGFLYVLGRAKSLLIGHDGEKYSPEGIEEAIVGNSAYIDQIMLHNDQSPCTAALVVLNKDNVINYLKVHNLNPHDDFGQEKALKLIESEIGEFKASGKFAGEFPERWLPAAIAVLGEGFTEQNHFLNSTLKMVRGRITEFYKDRIDFLYTSEGKNICNHQNKMIIKRMG
ncbi:MAG: AMP-binding protein [Bacteroidetes bacterium]|nr:AMP-binding protein [Bacteroidota bacterium]